MMRILVTSAALLALIAVASASNQTQCSAFEASNVVISVSTRRNSSGHWNIAVDVNNEAQRLSVNNHDHGVALTLGQTTSFCNNTDSVRLFASATVSTPTPPPGYQLMMGLGYYRFSPVALLWQDARDSCEADGGHLLVINSELEANVVREFFTRAATFTNYTASSYIHLGFHDRYKEGEYVTVLGTPVANTGYLQWLSGHPSGGTSYNCGGSETTGKLVIWPCSNRYAYICEFGYSK